MIYGQASGAIPPFTIERLNQLGSLTITRPTLRHFVADPGELHGRWNALTAWLAEGRLVTHIGRTYPMDEVRRAHEELAGRATVGKLLLVPPAEAGALATWLEPPCSRHRAVVSTSGGSTASEVSAMTSRWHEWTRRY